MKMKKTASERYQDGGIEGMKGLKLPDEIEIKDEKSYNIKNNIPDISDKYQKFFEYIANKEKENIDHEILSSKVDDINFYDRYNTL